MVIEYQAYDSGGVAQYGVAKYQVYYPGEAVEQEAHSFSKLNILFVEFLIDVYGWGKAVEHQAYDPGGAAEHVVTKHQSYNMGGAAEYAVDHVVAKHQSYDTRGAAEYAVACAVAEHQVYDPGRAVEYMVAEHQAYDPREAVEQDVHSF